MITPLCDTFDVVKMINIHAITNNSKCLYLLYSERHKLDKIIKNITNGINNNPDQIKINIFVDFRFDNYELFRYFMKFIDELKISPLISLIIKNDRCLDYVEGILIDFNVTKLVFRKLDPHVMNTMMDINYDKILKLILHGKGNNYDPNELADFLSKFINLKSIVTTYVNVESCIPSRNACLKKINVNLIEWLREMLKEIVLILK